MNEEQVLYLGRWVSKRHFTAFVYNKSGEYLAKSYKEFARLISSGTWFAEKDFSICKENCHENEINTVDTVAEFNHSDLKKKEEVIISLEEKLPEPEKNDPVIKDHSKVKKCRNQLKP